MTFVIGLILGLAIGIGAYYWQQYRFKRKLARILTASSDTAGLIPVMASSSLVQREMTYLTKKCQDLEADLQTWQSLLAEAPISYLQVDEQNQLIWCNRQARQLLKIDRWQPGQIRLLLEVVRSYELDQLIEQTRSVEESQVQKWVYYPTYYVESDDRAERETSIALKGFSYPLSQGQVGVFLENQQPLVELSRSRDRAFSDLTHELRTPLTSIALVAETLQKRLENPERRWTEQMLQEIARLMTLIEEWLDISQLQESSTQRLSYEPVELRDLILTAWQSLVPLAQQKDISLDDRGDDTIYLQADRSRLLQVFLNLLDNAIKYSPPQSDIRVNVKAIPAANEIDINIIDSGAGFNESDLPFVFDRLYRGDSSRVRHPKAARTSELLSHRHGSGLGLAIAQQIIKAHNGSITAKNHPETGGAWLQITIPQQKCEEF